jgi:hypothetical protein
MSLARFQRTVVDNTGAVLSGASVEVRIQDTNALASIYSNRAGTTAKSNPFTVGSDGIAAFYAAGNAYKITATSGANTITWEYVGIGTAQELDEDDIQSLLDTAVANVASTGFTLVIDNRGSAIGTGIKANVRIPFNCTVTGWTLTADQTGSIVIDVWKDTYANYPPTSGDSIAGTEKPTLSSATKNEDTSLSTWTTSLNAGDILRFNVDSVSTVTRAELHLHLTRV